MAHGMVLETSYAICNPKIKLGKVPNLAWKESPGCSRCERILTSAERSGAQS